MPVSRARGVLMGAFEWWAKEPGERTQWVLDPLLGVGPLG